MTAPELLYGYQRDVIAAFHRTREHKRRIILVAPTGAGKTVIGANIISSFVRTAKSALVLSHRREIISHTSKKLRAAGISHGIIQAGFPGARTGASRQHCDIARARGSL
jgi:DNA repair protein RadD